MKFRTYWVIMQPFTVVVLALISLAAAGAFHWFAPFASHRTGAAPFVALTLLGPFFAGCIISHTLHATLHRPFSITLPHLRRNLLQWHIPTLALFALLLAHWAYKLDSSLPRPVTASVTFAGLCLMLPFEAGLRWYGSSKRLLAIISVVLLLSLCANETRAVLLFLPALTVVSSLALATLCCQLTFNRSRLRKRARTPLSSMVETPSAETEQRQTMADTPRLGRSWTHGPIGSSTFTMIRAILHETYGYRSVWTTFHALLTPLALVVIPAIAYVTSQLIGNAGHKISFGQFVYQLIWDHQSSVAYNVVMQQIVLVSIFRAMTVVLALPRPQNLYSLSRAKRAHLTFVISLLQAGVQLLAASCVLLAMSWLGAQLAGQSFHLLIAPDFLVDFIALAPLLPAMLWVNVYSRIHPPKIVLANTIVSAGPIILAVTLFSTTAWRSWQLSPAGLTTTALLLAISLYAYRAALFRFYRRGDLVQRKPSR